MPDYLLTEELQREARRCFKQLAKVFGGTMDNQKPLPIAVKEHLLAKDIRANSLATLKNSLNSFAAFYPEETVQSITCDKIDKWMASGDYKSKSRKNRLINVKSFFNRCVKRGLIEKNPCDGVEVPSVDFKPPEIMPVADVGKLLNTCQKSDPALIGYLALILFGGLRSKESARARPENVHDGIVDIGGAQTKLNVRRCFPVQPVLKAWLDVPGAEIGGKNVYARFVALRKLAGVNVPDNGLRHTSVSCWLPILGAEECAKMHGHSVGTMMRHYASLVTPEEAKRFVELRPIPIQ
jgi:hypothetical protein